MVKVIINTLHSITVRYLDLPFDRLPSLPSNPMNLNRRKSFLRFNYETSISVRFQRSNVTDFSRRVFIAHQCTWSPCGLLSAAHTPATASSQKNLLFASGSISLCHYTLEA